MTEFRFPTEPIEILTALRDEYVRTGFTASQNLAAFGEGADVFAANYAAALAASGVDAMIAGGGGGDQEVLREAIRTFATGVLREGVEHAHRRMHELGFIRVGPDVVWTATIQYAGAAELLGIEF